MLQCDVSYHEQKFHATPYTVSNADIQRPPPPPPPGGWGEGGPRYYSDEEVRRSFWD